MQSSCLVFFVNGAKVVEEHPDPEWTLLQYIRTKLRLRGTKLGCGEGACGACTVMVSRLDRETHKVQHLSVNACITPVCSLHGAAVTTVEGVGSVQGGAHAVQARLAKSHGSQCGFCTPGIVMAMYSLLREHPRPSREQMDTALQANLCRCTGYRPIIEGFSSFVQSDIANQLGEGKSPCKQNGNAATCEHATDEAVCCKTFGDIEDCCAKSGNAVLCCINARDITDKLTNQEEFPPYDPAQEPSFPAELTDSNVYDLENLIFKGERSIWYRPLTLNDLEEIKNQHPNAKIVVGYSEIGLEIKAKNAAYPVLVQPTNIKELNGIQIDNNGMKIGASVTLSQIENHFKSQLKELPEFKIQIMTAIIEMFQYFAGKQVRNVASMGGNIMTGSPISDLNPIFMASGCNLEVTSKKYGTRNVKMDHNFFTSYRTNIIKPEEILVNISIPYTQENQYFIAYKQAKRRDDDITIVNAAFNLELSRDDKINKISLAFGGMAATTLLATKTAEKLLGKVWDSNMLEIAMEFLLDELTIDPGAPGGMVTFRRSLTLGFFMKFYLAVQERRGRTISASERSASKQFHTLSARGAQYFELAPRHQPEHDLVGRPIEHLSGLKHATGEAVYCDDIPEVHDELHLALVTSTRAYARIVNIDSAHALSLPGVVAFFCGRDIGEAENKIGLLRPDEQIFMWPEVTAQGQVVGAVLANTRQLAVRASKLVTVEYEDLQPVILTMEEAVAADSFHPGLTPVQLGPDDVTDKMAACAHVVEGEVRVGGQEHFYLETQSCLVIPGREDGEIELFSSTQMPSTTQQMVARMLELPLNRVVVRTKRLGGAFGGKETRSTLIALPAAFAAHKLRRAVRCMLERDVDMMITGGRSPFLGRYKVGFSPAGEINACQVEMYTNAGVWLDLSEAVMKHAVSNLQNSYSIPHLAARGQVCKTNLPSNTAFRGFGLPQSMLVMETCLEHVATQLGMDPADVRRVNLYKDGDRTVYGQEVENCTVRRCWDECLTMSNYQQRKIEVQHFNKENRWKKRGISVLPLTYGVAFGEKFMNQAGALVHVYVDGSVLLSHAGVEMGQGLHTKMVQVASRALGVAEVDIHVSDTSTDKVPNTMPTAASVSSDLNGMAVLAACEALSQRLAPYKEADPKGGWKSWVRAAYFDRVSLSATGFYATPDINFDWNTKSGRMVNYFTFGAACSEVQIDCLTGDHQVLRTDIVMDLGESINPAIDIGQIEGGFTQGYGLFTMEELLYSPQGALLTRGPSTYKIPGFGDVPAQFNVSLLRGASNPRAVYSSKAVGEPPLLLAASIFFAIKSAISSARTDSGLQGDFRLDSPATAARIRLACADHITAKITEPEPGSFTPWNIVP